MRRYEPRFDGESAMFAMLNRGKKSLVLDLKNESDRARLMPLVKRADVLVEQFRPGVMARLGLGPKIAAQDQSAADLLLDHRLRTGWARAPRKPVTTSTTSVTPGLLALQPGPMDRPNVPPALIADIGGGTLPAVMNILLALRQRDRTGKGSTIDIAMSDAMFTFASHAIAVGHITGTFPGAGDARLDRRLAALSALSDQGRQAGRLRRAGAEILAGVHLGDWPCRPNSSTTAAIRRRPNRRWQRSLLAAMPPNGNRC